MTEAGCLAHTRRKFHEPRANHSSTIAEGALKLFTIFCDIDMSLQHNETLNDLEPYG